MNNDLKSKGGLSRIVNAMKYSYDGLKAAWLHEAAFRQLVGLHLLLLVFNFCLDFDAMIRMILLCLSGLSLIVELLNSAIEAVVDDISLDIRPLAKRAKDMGSAAQTVALVLTVLVWCVALFG